MIIWLNGAFGAGKTTIATALHKELAGSYLYDPENLGSFLQTNLPTGLQVADFQDFPEWRQWTSHLLLKMTREFKGDIIVPMTLSKSAYFDEIMTTIRHGGGDIRHFVLEVERRVIAQRLATRSADQEAWGLSKLDDSLAFFASFGDERLSNQGRSETDVVVELLTRLSEESKPLD